MKLHLYFCPSKRRAYPGLHPQPLVPRYLYALQDARTGFELRRRLNRVSVWMCEYLHRLPESLHLKDTVRLDPGQQATTGGAYADVYKGGFRGRPVAIKTLRMFSHLDAERQKSTKVL